MSHLYKITAKRCCDNTSFVLYYKSLDNAMTKYNRLSREITDVVYDVQGSVVANRGQKTED